MMMLGGTKQGRTLSKLNDSVASTNTYNSLSKSSSISNTNPQPVNYTSVDYSDLIQKTKFYDDPILYSSDDETKKANNA